MKKIWVRSPMSGHFQEGAKTGTATKCLLEVLSGYDDERPGFGLARANIGTGACGIGENYGILFVRNGMWRMTMSLVLPPMTSLTRLVTVIRG